MEIAFDESGNTGSNLLDKNQSIYALASVQYNSEETETLLATVKTKMDEAHFTKLRKGHQDKILRFLNHDLISNSRIKYSLSDKKFETICRLTDLLIEPVLFAEGINFYQNGTNMATANMIGIFSITDGYQLKIEKLLYLFQQMIRSKSSESIKAFYDYVKSIRVGLLNDGIIDMIIASEHLILSILKNCDKYTLDPAYPSLIYLANLWYYELGSEFDILHDNSKQIEHWKEMILFLSNKKHLKEKEMAMIGKIKMTYPLKINELKLVDSKAIKQVQIADLIASSISYAINKKMLGREDHFAESILNSKAFGFSNSRYLFPTQNVTPESLGEEGKDNNEILNYLIDAMMKKQEIENKRES